MTQTRNAKSTAPVLRVWTGARYALVCLECGRTLHSSKAVSRMAAAVAKRHECEGAS